MSESEFDEYIVTEELEQQEKANRLLAFRT